MGLLDTILSTIDAKKRSAKRGIMDMIDNPQQWAGMQANRIQEDRYGGAENAQAMKQYLSKQPYDPKALTAANDALRNASINESLGAVTAWHGSPHKFDKFDMSKIGTGEGAQAYGHGLYLAESPDVAKSYSRNQFGGDSLLVNGMPLTDRMSTTGLPAGIRGAISKEAGLSKMPDEFVQRLDTFLTNRAPDQHTNKIQSFLDTVKNSDLSYTKEGNLYKTDIPDEAIARFLDWDKPLSEQAPEVQAAIRKEMPNYSSGVDKRKAADAYFELANRAIKQGHVGQNGEYASLPAGFNEFDAASKRLQELGIPGIRYLDGGSRSAGQGSSNYVLFDDQLPRILERNGQPTGLQPWAKGEWKGLLDEPAPNQTTLYRGLDRPNDPNRINPIDWYSESKDLAEIYGNNIITKEKPQRMNPVDLGFRDYMTEVKKDDVLDRVKRAVIDRFNSGSLDKETAMRNVDKIEDMRGGSDFKRVHEWISGDPSISSILRDSGYDSLSHVEKGTQTYGLLNDIPAAPKLTEFEQRHLTAQKNAALPVEQGGLGLPEGNTAMQRAELLGYNTPAYHATQANVDKFRKTTKTPYGDRFFFSPDAGYASQYADIDAAIAGNTDKVKSWKAKNAGDAGPNVMPVFLKEGEFKDWTHISPEYVVRDPSAVRSRFAAFDPKRRHEADLLGYADPYLLGAMGAGGLLGMGGYSMMNDK